MPFNQLQRRDSWPPTILRIGDEDRDDETPPIDRNPFSYFLTPPEELDMDLGEHFDAGIESSDTPAETRHVSPSSVQHHPVKEQNDDIPLLERDFSLAIPMTLREFTERQNLRAAAAEAERHRRPSPPSRKHSSSLAASRGRSQYRIATLRAKGRIQTRSLPIFKRPHSWREPSPEVYSIPEERESGDDTDDDDEGLYMATPSPSHELSLAQRMELDTPELSPNLTPMKPKKRVRFAFP